MKIVRIVLSLSLLASASAHSQSSTTTDGPNGTQVVVSGNEGARAFHSRWGYAPAVRAGDLIVLSGVIAGPAPGDGRDAEAFKRSLVRTFENLEEHLQALDASLEDVIRVNSYHVWDSPYFDGDKLAHMEAVRDVKNQFMKTATPAWTAIGVSELFTESGLVEIELTVYAPIKLAVQLEE
ncbi:MAG: Rid family hydrolase [Pseudomonadota bacterium]